MAERNWIFADRVKRTLTGLLFFQGRIGHETSSTRYFASVRAMHKPKRNFMKLLDGEF